MQIPDPRRSGTATLATDMLIFFKVVSIKIVNFYLSSRSNHALVVVLSLMSISLGCLSMTSLYRAAPPMMTAAFAGNSALTV